MSVEDEIKQILKARLSPAYLEIKNQSHHHAGHAGDNGSGESHFRVIVVSDMFKEQSRIERQRLVFQSLEGLLKERIHALSIKAMTIQEYSAE